MLSRAWITPKRVSRLKPCSAKRFTLIKFGSFHKVKHLKIHIRSLDEFDFVAELLANGGRDFNNKTGEGLWLQVRDELIEVPIHEENLNTTKFVKQNCFVRMGTRDCYLPIFNT